MKTNSIVRSLMDTLTNQCSILEKGTSAVNKAREEAPSPPNNTNSVNNGSKTESGNEEVSFLTKLSILAVPSCYVIDFLFIKQAADYFSMDFESEIAKNLIRIIVPAVIIGIDITLGAIIIKATELFEETGKRFELILWKTAGIFFLTIVPIVVLSTIVASNQLSAGHILLYAALTILSVISHVVLIFNPNFHLALKYFLNLFYQWIKRGREIGIETQERFNETKQVKMENKFKENYLKLLATIDRLKEHNLEINLNQRLSKDALELVEEFYPQNKDHKKGDNSVILPFSKTGT